MEISRFSMEVKRRVGDRMSVVLLLAGYLASTVAFPGVNSIEQNLDCTNDYINLMFCEFEAQNCAEFNMTLQNNSGYEDKHCIFKLCDSGRCCCRIEMILVTGETHTAIVRKGGETVASKLIRVRESVKPIAPTITSAKESNGNFQVMWRTNMKPSISDSLTFNVTYRKKGDTEKESEFVQPTTYEGLNYYEILGRHLEPSTTYMVSVKSYSYWSGRFSDSSNEVEFITPASPRSLISAVIISLSIAAVILSGAIYGCYVKLKEKWWDTVAECPNPKLLNMHPSEQEVLKPVPPVISSMCVEPLDPEDSKPWSKASLTDSSSGSVRQSSGISTGSSCLSYANTEPPNIIASVQDAAGKALAIISPVSPVTTNPLTEMNNVSGLFCAPYKFCGVRADGMSSGSSGIINKTYSILVPSFPDQIMVQTQPEMLCDSAYRPSEGDIVICADQQAPACPLVASPPVVSSLMPTDMSYQQCNADSGRFSYAEDSSLSSMSSGTNTLASCDPVSRVEATELHVITGETTVCDENPCYGCVPAGSHSFPPVDDDYQAFQSLVEQPDVLLSERSSGEEEEHSSKYPEGSFTKMPHPFFSPVVPGFTNNVQGGQTPFASLISAHLSMPVITDSGYQSV
ncbi:uncharacterized protein LOC121606108 isoform X2 [Chelmon rostratus]|uniref:uncharacterized protein LOC121606108 isoform X2 n=1 Tax=Chelmon rostratus TaxID=109905 RepID=UPI001BE69E2D|nr:uncharacterized protein LOC121606108 isoform X2 [Chelmon rostratus]